MSGPKDAFGLCCPHCGKDSGVIDSRPTGDAIRRRRKCYSCDFRFTTHETVTGEEGSKLSLGMTKAKLRVVARTLGELAEELSLLGKEEGK